MRRILGIVAVSVLVSSAQPAFAAPDALELGVTSAKQALEQKLYKKAETALKKGLSKATDASDAARGAANVLLARIYRESGKISEAALALQDAHENYKKLGHVEPAYAEEFNELNKIYRTIEVPILGASANALSKNGAVISMAKTDAGAHVEIKMPAPYENTLNNPKVDGLQLAPLVSFDIQSAPQDIRVTNIKGFKIHSVEKNTWANLMELQIGALDQEGKYDAEITAGKAGFVKKVPSKLPFKAYEPVSAIANQLTQFSAAAPALDLPVVSTQPADTSSPAGTTSSSPTSSMTTNSTTDATSSTPVSPTPATAAPPPATSASTSSQSSTSSASATPTSTATTPTASSPPTASPDLPGAAITTTESVPPAAQPGVVVVPKKTKPEPKPVAESQEEKSKLDPSGDSSESSKVDSSSTREQSDAPAGKESRPNADASSKEHRASKESSSNESKSKSSSKIKRDRVDDDDDDDDDDEKEDDHAILHGVQKLIKSVKGDNKK